MTVFVDTNIILYSLGRDDALRRSCAEIVRHAAADTTNAQMVVSAEVLQEVFHVLFRRYGKARAREAIEAAHASFVSEAVLPEDVLDAARMDAGPGLQARDLVHLATMHRLGLTRIVSSDRAFDQVAGIERLDPLEFAAWRERIFTPRG